jgi:hypothetical protein
MGRGIVVDVGVTLVDVAITVDDVVVDVATSSRVVVVTGVVTGPVPSVVTGAMASLDCDELGTAPVLSVHPTKIVATAIESAKRTGLTRCPLLIRASD